MIKFEKIIASIACIIILYTIMPAKTFGPKIYASQTMQNELYEYEILEDETILLTRYVGPSDTEELEIPESIKGMEVTSIGKDIFNYVESQTIITIPKSVKNIDEAAFDPCYKITRINVSEENENYSSDENGVFFNKDKTKLIKYPRAKSEIEYTIPAEVVDIQYNAFDYCRNLQSIIVNSENTNYTSIEGVLFSKDETKLVKYPNNSQNAEYSIPEGTKTIEEHAFYGCSKLTNVTIPEGVQSIGKYNFYNCGSLTQLIIPQSVENIDDYAISSCVNLSYVSVGKGVISIGENVFDNCRILSNINVDNENQKYTSIGGVLFNKEETKIIKYLKNETNYIIPASVTEIEKYAFRNCQNLINISIPEGVTKIGHHAFENCRQLININIPEGVTNIESYVFSNCRKLKEIVFSENITNIGEYAFEMCDGLTDLTIPKKVTSIEKGAFRGCYYLKNVIISENVVNIGDEAFRNCGNLINITIPPKVNSIGKNAFIYCHVLEEINVDFANVEYISVDGVLFDKEKTKIIKYPPKEGDYYKIPNSVKIIDEYAFERCGELKKITIPEGVCEIGERAFADCYNLNEIEIPEGVEKIEDGTFENTGIKKIVLPESLISLGGCLFYDGILEEIYIGKNVKNIGTSTFAYSSCGEKELTIYTNNDYAVTYAQEKDINCVFDNEAPIVEVQQNTKEWTKEGVTLTVKAADEIVGLASKPYSFDGGTTWQDDNTKGYDNNVKGINIKVKDKLGNIASKEVNITNIIELERIDVVVGNEEKQYVEGQKIEKEDIKVLEIYNDGSTKEIESFEVIGGDNLQVGNNTIIIRYTYGGENKEVEQKITAISKQIESISIKKEQDQKEYIEGQPFDSKGMNIIAKYNDGSEKEIDNYIIEYGEKLDNEKVKILITYTEEGISKTVEHVIIVKPIEITSEKYKLKADKIDKIQPKTTVIEFKNNIKTNADIIEVYDIKGNKLSEEDYIGTEMMLKLNNVKTFELITLGDVNGDGDANFRDILAINKHRLNKLKLKTIYAEAGDIDDDGNTDFEDILKINKFRLNNVSEL